MAVGSPKRVFATQNLSLHPLSGHPDPVTTENSLLAMLRAAALEHPDKEFVRVGGSSFDYSSALARVEATAKGLLECGIEPGDRVGIMAGNTPETIWAWLGTNAARAIDVPFNAEVRGNLLSYFVQDAGPKALVGTPEYLDLLEKHSVPQPELVVSIGEPSQAFQDSQRITFDELIAIGQSSLSELLGPSSRETATIMYTSGTTGPSKGVMLPQRYYPANARNVNRFMKMTSDDVCYCVQPLFHIDARAFLATVLEARATIAIGQRFSVSRFWDEVREHEATVFSTIGTMLWMLSKQPPSMRDREQPARVAMCSSTPGEVLRDFESRFGVQVIEAYGMTECVLITTEVAEKTLPGRIGRPIPELSCQIVDNDDLPVGQGDIGELVYRPCEPNAMMQGYWNKPEATVETWRNMWFHTGDLVREHDDGTYEYIGRKKDSIRRRGENVSAWEVEQAVAAHPRVLEVAAIGVPSEVGEEDVAVLVVTANDGPFDPADLVDFVSRDLPRFAVPRYVEVVDSLPKTPSERIEKGKVRERGITSAAWDAELA